jgi:hypothetical protein
VLSQGKGLIYDATNFKRALRIDFLHKVNEKVKREENQSNNPLNLTWIAWHIDTPLETSITWNQQRERQVPEEIITSMHKILKDFPPITGEGFAKINKIDAASPEFFHPSTTITAAIQAKIHKQIEKQIQNCDRSITNSQNRYAKLELHQYSQLIDCDRLLHLISLIIRYPGIGSFHKTNPKLLKNLLGYELEIHHHQIAEIQEITAIIKKKFSQTYAQESAIIADLEYLTEVGIIPGKDKNQQNAKNILESKFISQQNFLHSYSDKSAFERLIGTIKLIVNQPFLIDSGNGSLITLAKALSAAGVTRDARSGLPMLRKDIQNILKPYKILPEIPMRNGYFAGTGILSQQELIKVFEILQSQAKNLDDPLTLDFYNKFKERMLQVKFIDSEENIYPIRSISNHAIVDEKYIDESSLLKKLPYLESAILKGELLELSNFINCPKHPGDENSFFTVYPLQVVFHNLAWYLGYECVSDTAAGLIRFQRLDRLFIGRPQNKYRPRKEQEKSLDKLQKLLQCSAGIYLGNSLEDQKKFLSSNKEIRSQVCMTIELRFDDKTYNFIAEGTKRFAQIKMSLPNKSENKFKLPKSIFCLPKAKQDKQFPNRFQVVLPKWCLDEFDLLRWIIGFGASVKVVEPPELVEKINNLAKGIIKLY